MLTDEQLAVIRARCEAATPGPWKTGRGVDLERPTYSCSYVVPRAAYDAEKDHWEQWERNAAFIGHARDDVPALLTEVERLRVENAGLLQHWLETAKELADMLPGLEAMRLLQSVGRPS